MFFLLVFAVATLVFATVLDGGARAGLIMNHKLFWHFLIYAGVVIAGYLGDTYYV